MKAVFSYSSTIIILYGLCQCVVLACPTACKCTKDSQSNNVTCPGGGETLNDIIHMLDASTTYLEVIATKINSLSSIDFTNIKATNLQTLIIRNSYINNIHDSTFLDVQHLVHLNLTHNSISDISTNAFAGLTQLKTLDLSSNRISTLGEQFLPLIQLTNLDLGENRLTTINSGVFRVLAHLQTLTLNGNKLQDLHGDSLKGLGSLRNLNLRHCDLINIPNDLFSNSRIIRSLDVGFNRLIVLPKAEILLQVSPYINSLIADGNQISSLNINQFSGMHMVRLNLAKNRIQTIQYGVFDHFDVIDLDLSENNIDIIHRNAFSQIALQLTNLNLAGNPLRTIPSGCLDGLYRLKHLNLSLCALNHLDTNQFGTLSNLQTLDLSKNRIPYIPHPVLETFNGLTHINLEQNAWYCDCHILPFRKWLFTSNVGKLHCSSTLSRDCRNPKCSTPPNLSGQLIRLTDDRLECLFSEEKASMKTSTAIGISIGCIIGVTFIIALLIICIRYSQGKITLSCNGSEIDSTELGDKDKSTKPFHDAEVGSLDESDKSFVVRNFFSSMVKNPSIVSRGSPEMSRKDDDLTSNRSYTSLHSVSYNPMGRESAV